jgi:hypothetical protein
MAGKTVKAVVAERRTVWVGSKSFGPGEEVSLPSEEVTELRASRFLVDPAAPDAPETGDGPTFETAQTETSGPTVNAG